MDGAPFGAALEPYVDAATTQLDASIRQTAEVEGGQMSPAQAVALALQELDGISCGEATP